MFDGNGLFAHHSYYNMPARNVNRILKIYLLDMEFSRVRVSEHIVQARACISCPKGISCSRERTYRAPEGAYRAPLV